MPIIAVVISTLISTLFVLFYLNKNYKEFFKSPTTTIDKKELFDYLKYLSLSSFSVLLLFYTDVLVLGKFVSPDFVGYYKTASSIVSIALSILIFTSILYPILTRTSKEKTKNIISIISNYLFIISLPIIVMLMVLSKYFIRLLFGYEYLQAYLPLIALSFLVIITPLSELFRVSLNSKGYTKATAKIITIGSLLNLALNIIFIYSFFKFGGNVYAILGAGISTILSRLYIVISLQSSSKKKIQAGLGLSSIIRPLISSIVMWAFMFYFTKLIYGRANLFLVGLEIVLSIFIYLFILFLIKGISKRDINYLKEILIEMKQKK
jgi:O-antigen/teichoic acid export membrane protein